MRPVRHALVPLVLLLAQSCVEGGLGADAGLGDAARGPIGPIQWCPALATCDDLDPCTDGDVCAGGVCVGTPRVCETPPGQCYADVGTCAEGDCVYEARDGACDDNDPCTLRDRCESGACVGTRLRCDAPPAPRCVDSQILRTYAAGRCDDGGCVYDRFDVVCTGGGCVRDACVCTPLSPTATVVQSGLGTSGAIDPRITIDAGDGVHLTYRDPSAGLAYARPNGSAWSVETIDPDPSSGLGSALVAMTEDVYVAYERDDRGIWLATRLHGAADWTLRAIATGTVGVAPTDVDIAIGPDGTVHAVFSSEGTGARRAVSYAFGRDGPFTSAVLASEADAAGGARVWLDAGVQALYRDRTSETIRLLTKLDGVSWLDSAVASAPLADAHVAAIDRDGGVHVVLREPTSGGWAYARRDFVGAPWIVEAIPPQVVLGTRPAIWGAPGGELHLSYERGGSQYYARRTIAGVWSEQSLAAGVSSPSPTSIAVDSVGTAHVAIHEGLNGELLVYTIRACE
ncbi:MAG: hypothetical protein AB7S26_20650 [Sandaracinaceae bacterium]